MKRTLLLLAAFAMITMHGCKKDPAKKPSTIAQLLIAGGDWYTVKFVFTNPDGTTFEKIYPDYQLYLNDSFISDAQFFDTGIYFQDRQIYSLNWSLKGDLLTLQNLVSVTTTKRVVQLTDKILVLETIEPV